MKFFLAFVAVVAVAVASPLKLRNSELAQMEAIVAAINSPSTDPATAALLEAQLAAILGIDAIAVGAPIVTVPEAIVLPTPAVPGVVLPAPGTLPILPEPELILPMPVVEAANPAPSPVAVPSPVWAPSPVAVASPVVVGDVPAGSSPLVQIIVNVNELASGAAAVPAPAAVQPVIPSPVSVVEAAEPVVPGPVSVVEEADNSVAAPVVPEPVNIVEQPLQPVAVGTPILPAPVMVLPEELN